MRSLVRFAALLVLLSVALLTIDASSAPKPLLLNPGGTGVVKISAGAQVLPATAVSLTADVSGVLTTANGGTGLAAPGASGNVLLSNGTIWTSSALSSWSPSSWITALDANDLHAWELTDPSGTTFTDTGSGVQVALSITVTGNMVLGTQGLLGVCPQFGLDTSGAGTFAASGGRANVSSFSDLPTGAWSVDAWVFPATFQTGSIPLLRVGSSGGSNL